LSKNERIAELKEALQLRRTETAIEMQYLGKQAKVSSPPPPQPNTLPPSALSLLPPPPPYHRFLNSLSKRRKQTSYLNKL
jgi:hypothetical protein